MDLLYRKKNYQESLLRLKRLSNNTEETIQEEDKRIHFFHEETNDIIETLRSEGDLNNVKIHYVLLIFPILGMGLWYALSTKVAMTPLLLALALVLYIWIAHRIMQTAIAQAQPKIKQDPPEEMSPSFLQSKLDYAEGGIIIKKKRMILMVLFYILFFPIFLLLLQSISFGPGPFTSTVMNVLLVYTVSSAMWYWYFDKSFDDYDDVEEMLRLIRKKSGTL